MGGCQGKMLPASASSQSTVVGDEDHGDEKKLESSQLGPEEQQQQEQQEEAHLPVAFGRALREAHFSFDRDYHNLNHASWGAIPRAIQSRLRHYEALHERRPDHFIRYAYPALLRANRAAAAALLRAPSADDVVFVLNATTGVNTVLRGLAWSADGADEVLYFGTAYGACAKTVAYVRDATRGLVRGRRVPLAYPASDASVLRAFEDAVARARDVEGKRPRVALFDTVSSTPGVRFPFERLVARCRALGVLSLVDAAQGVGMLPLDLAALDPDFLVTNCHKWLFVPRACAVFYVARRNQHLIRSTVPTSHSYVPADDRDDDKEDGEDGTMITRNGAAGSFAEMFAYVGTANNSAYLCVKDAIEWRQEVLGGEDRIREYCFGLARDGGQKVAEALGTWVMQNEEGTLIHCSVVNVALPLVVVAEEEEEEEEEKGAEAGKLAEAGGTRAGETLIPYKDAQRVWEWMTKRLDEDYQTWVPIYHHAGRFWVRLSAQVYLDLDDFDWAGKTLKDLSDRVARKEYDL